MNETNIACAKCGAEIPLTEAVTHRLREQMEADFNRWRAESNAALAARERKIAKERAALEKRAGTIDDEVAKRLQDERTKFKADAEHAS